MRCNDFPDTLSLAKGIMNGRGIWNVNSSVRTVFVMAEINDLGVKLIKINTLSK